MCSDDEENMKWEDDADDSSTGSTDVSATVPATMLAIAQPAEALAAAAEPADETVAQPVAAVETVVALHEQQAAVVAPAVFTEDAPAPPCVPAVSPLSSTGTSPVMVSSPSLPSVHSSPSPHTGGNAQPVLATAAASKRRVASSASANAEDEDDLGWGDDEDEDYRDVPSK